MDKSTHGEKGMGRGVYKPCDMLLDFSFLHNMLNAYHASF